MTTTLPSGFEYGLVFTCDNSLLSRVNKVICRIVQRYPVKYTHVAVLCGNAVYEASWRGVTVTKAAQSLTLSRENTYVPLNELRDVDAETLLQMMWLLSTRRRFVCTNYAVSALALRKVRLYYGLTPDMLFYIVTQVADLRALKPVRALTSVKAVNDD
jgi:hypothetical protein